MSSQKVIFIAPITISEGDRKVFNLADLPVVRGICKTAVQAALWAGYHLEQLKVTNPRLNQEKPHAGFGIVRDDLRSGFMEQMKSDWLSRFAKAWKREAERIADGAGRHGRPIVAIHADMFSGVHQLPHGWLGASAELDDIAIVFIRSEAISEMPWREW